MFFLSYAVKSLDAVTSLELKKKIFLYSLQKVLICHRSKGLESEITIAWSELFVT